MYRLHSTMLARPRARALAARAFVIAALAIITAGCKTAENVVASYPEDYRQRHPIVMYEGKRNVELFIGTNRGSLTPAQRADVLAVADTWRREATGGIIIAVPSGTPNARAAHDAEHEVRAILVAAGIPMQGIVTQNYQPSDPGKLATLKIKYPKIVAEAGPCGLWPEDLGPSNWREHAENRQFWNLGCATQRNLASMIDNPADLAQPRGEIPAYEARRTVVLDKYRKGESTATVYPSEGKGKISNVGQ